MLVFLVFDESIFEASSDVDVERMHFLTLFDLSYDHDKVMIMIILVIFIHISYCSSARRWNR